MNKDRLDILIDKLRKLPVNPETIRAFRISSVYGSAKLSNPSVTLWDVIEVDKRLKAKGH